MHTFFESLCFSRALRRERLSPEHTSNYKINFLNNNLAYALCIVRASEVCAINQVKNYGHWLITDLILKPCSIYPYTVHYRTEDNRVTFSKEIEMTYNSVVDSGLVQLAL